jgi:hypothetical protein
MMMSLHNTENATILSFRAKFHPPLSGGWNTVEEPAVWPAEKQVSRLRTRNDNAKFPW